MTEEKTIVCFLDEKTGKPLGSVELPTKLVKELKQKAYERRISVSAVITEAITDFIKNTENSTKKNRRS